MLAVGTDDDVRALRDRPPRWCRCPGGWSCPGFQDAHIHAAFGGRNLLNVNLDDLATKDAYLERIATFARAHPDLELDRRRRLVQPGVRRHEGPRREDLDAVVPTGPCSS